MGRDRKFNGDLVPKLLKCCTHALTAISFGPKFLQTLIKIFTIQAFPM